MFDRINDLLGVRFDGSFFDGAKFVLFWWFVSMFGVVSAFFLVKSIL